MNPETGNHVKLILKNNTVVEGIVEEWFANYVKLKSLDGQSMIIIPHPNEDIMLIKIFLDDPMPSLEFVKLKKDEGTEVKTSPYLQEQEAEIEAKFQAALNLPSEDPSRIKTLAELKKLKNDLERKIVSDKVKNHYIDGARKAQYGYPGFFKKPSP